MNTLKLKVTIESLFSSLVQVHSHVSINIRVIGPVTGKLRCGFLTVFTELLVDSKALDVEYVNIINGNGFRGHVVTHPIETRGCHHCGEWEFFHDTV